MHTHMCAYMHVYIYLKISIWTTSSCNPCLFKKYIAIYRATHIFLCNILKIQKNVKYTEHYPQFDLSETATVLFLRLTSTLFELDAKEHWRST